MRRGSRHGRATSGRRKAQLPQPVGDQGGDVTAQTKLALERIDQLLRRAGTDKSRALTAQVWLSDIRLFRQHNLAWNEWVDPQNPPVRACVQAELTAPGLLVEIMLTAAR